MAKIAQVVCVYPPYKGGMGKVAFEFQKQFNIKKHNCFVFTPNYKFGLRSVVNNKTVRTPAILKFGNAAFVPQLFFLLKKFDVIILHYPFFGAQEIITIFKLFYKKKKLIIHYHMDAIGLSLPGKILSLPASLFKTKLFKLADMVTCASLDYVKNSSLARLYDRMPYKFREMSFGVDQYLFYPNDFPEYPKNKKKHLLFVGGLDQAHYFKGLDVLLKAIAILPKQYNFCLDIVGDGNLKAAFQLKAEKLNLRSLVTFYGTLDNERLAQVYRNSYALVLPSINKGEAFGLVLLEAMASGVPVVASNLPGVRGVFQDKKQGFLFMPNNFIDLKNKLEIILSDENLRNNMSINALALVKEKYSWKKVGETLDKIISELKIT